MPGRTALRRDARLHRSATGAILGCCGGGRNLGIASRLVCAGRNHPPRTLPAHPANFRPPFPGPARAHRVPAEMGRRPKGFGAFFSPPLVVAPLSEGLGLGRGLEQERSRLIIIAALMHVNGSAMMERWFELLPFNC